MGQCRDNTVSNSNVPDFPRLSSTQLKCLLARSVFIALLFNI